MRIVIGLCALAALFSSLVWAQDDSRKALRICADPNYLPYSNQSQHGLENRIASLLAQSLQLPVEYTWFPQRMGFIRKTLRARDENNEYKCDVVMGVPAGFELTLTTEPYYRSSYVLVYVKGRGLDDVQSANDLLNLPPERRGRVRFGLAERNPGNLWLANHGLLELLHVAYPSQPADPKVQPGEFEQRDLLAGKIDATIMWGPIAGHFAKQAKEADIAVVSIPSTPNAPMDFDIAIGVRFGETGWRDQLDALLKAKASEINTVLTEFGVPLRKIP